MVENLDWIAIAQRGFEAWKAKPHNARWFRKIDGTPIPNDLTICIGQAFADELARRSPPPAVEGGWQPIETMPTGELDFILARTPDGRVMQWRASMLARNLKGPTPNHLSFPATEWMPAQLKDPKPLSGHAPLSQQGGKGKQE